MRSMISQVDYDQISRIIQDAVVDGHGIKKDNNILANIRALHDRHQIFEELYAQKIYKHDDVMFTSLAEAIIYVCLDMCIIIDLMNDFLSQQSERFELFKDKCEINSSEFREILVNVDTQIMKACQINDGSTCTKQIEEIAMMKDDLIERIN
ncbi:hypothetical protein THOM_0081 [Trachipleistophora hominis]|uniref:Uncharacterized protein n=1 Tax=Trachipleistophora hominis TaxID=72359 RepID=L7JZY7_TRAHO|nr:hypothetical protein THOM_0081 [Trachipleistophora hominis]